MSFLPILLIVLVLVIRYAGKDVLRKITYQTPLRKLAISIEDRAEIQLYLKNNTYYNNLSPAGKEKFEDRLIVFIKDKEFVGHSGLYVSDEMKIVIAASAIQLTFGLKYYKLESLERIVIHPDTFHLSLRSPEFKGATSTHVMHLSWKSVQEGNQIKDDNLNLGLHEMTHALKLTLYLGRRFDHVFAGRMEYWEELVHEKYNTFRNKPSFLRAYSKANTEEFFAVCVEAFFESPEKFKNELPEIYQSLVFLLNQDILNKFYDYEVSKNYFTGNNYHIPQPEDVKTSYKHSNYHWSVSVMVIGIFGFLPIMGVASIFLMIPFKSFFLIAFVFGTIGLLQKKYFYERKIFSGIYFTLYSYFGFGFVTTMLCAILNISIPISKTYVEKFSISNRYKYTYFNHLSDEPDKALEDYLNTHADSDPWSYKHKYAVLKYHYGLFGIRTMEHIDYTD